MTYYSKKRQKSKLTSTEDVLERLLKKSNSPLSQNFLKWKVKQQWSQIVGATFAQYTEPVHYTNGFLYIFVKNATYRQELSFLNKEIVEKVNQFVGKRWVKRIHFTHNKNIDFEQNLNNKGKFYLNK